MTSSPTLQTDTRHFLLTYTSNFSIHSYPTHLTITLKFSSLSHFTFTFHAYASLVASLVTLHVDITRHFHISYSLSSFTFTCSLLLSQFLNTCTIHDHRQPISHSNCFHFIFPLTFYSYPRTPLSHLILLLTNNSFFRFTPVSLCSFHVHVWFAESDPPTGSFWAGDLYRAGCGFAENSKMRLFITGHDHQYYFGSRVGITASLVMSYPSNGASVTDTYRYATSVVIRRLFVTAPVIGCSAFSRDCLLIFNGTKCY